MIEKIDSPPGGLEPPTFRLTAERASRLRHGGNVLNPSLLFTIYNNFLYVMNHS